MGSAGDIDDGTIVRASCGPGPGLAGVGLGGPAAGDRPALCRPLYVPLALARPDGPAVLVMLPDASGGDGAAPAEAEATASVGAPLLPPALRPALSAAATMLPPLHRSSSRHVPVLPFPPNIQFMSAGDWSHVSCCHLQLLQQPCRQVHGTRQCQCCAGVAGGGH